MKQATIVALAALMLAGASSAVSGATSVSSLNTVVVIGEGSRTHACNFAPLR